MVKRAVGTKACLLGKAVTCNYLRQDNFLEVLSSKKKVASSRNLTAVGIVSTPLFLSNLKIPNISLSRGEELCLVAIFDVKQLQCAFMRNNDIYFIFGLLPIFLTVLYIIVI